MAEAFGDETAYTVVGTGSMTFAAWDDAASRLARGLVGAGVAPGDRIALHLQAPNALRWMTAYAAVHRAGAVAVPFNPQLTRPEVARMLAHSGTTVAFVEHALLDRHEPGARVLVVDVPGADQHDRTPARGRARRMGGRPRPRPHLLPGTPGPGRARRHPLHVRHHRPPQGGGRTPRQFVPGPLPGAHLERRVVAPRQPALHVRRDRLRAHPDEARTAGHLPRRLRRRHLDRHRGARASRIGVPGPRHGHPAARAPRFAGADLGSVAAVHGRQRAAGPRRPRAAAGQAARPPSSPTTTA